MIRYLLDEVYFLECNHSDAMRPVQLEPQLSFLGEEKEQRYLTLGDARDMLSEHGQSLLHSISQLLSANLPQSSALPPTGSNAQPVASTSALPHPSPPGSTSIENRRRGRRRKTDIGGFPVGSFPPGLDIPDCEEGPEWWLGWVKQWEHADKDHGLIKALEHWPEAWRTGRLRGRYGKLWTNRSIVAKEYIE
jgi:hypothetical protein